MATFDAHTQAKIDAYSSILKILADIDIAVHKAYSDIQDAEATGQGPYMPTELMSLCAAMRRCVNDVDSLRQDIISTPMPGENAASKLAGGFKASAKSTVTFTFEDLAASAPEQHHTERLTLALEALEKGMPALNLSRMGAALTERGALVKARLNFQLRPQGGANVTPELTDLRKHKLPSAEMFKDFTV